VVAADQKFQMRRVPHRGGHCREGDERDERRRKYSPCLRMRRDLDRLALSQMDAFVNPYSVAGSRVLQVVAPHDMRGAVHLPHFGGEFAFCPPSTGFRRTSNVREPLASRALNR
jgi:hypothetical protein